MSADLFHAIWPFYVALLVLLLTMIGRVLAIRIARSLDIHDRMLRSKQVRRDYIKHLRNRMNATAEILDD